MTTKTLAKQFVELCNQGKNFDVMQTLYAPHIVSVESEGHETAGQEAVIQKSRNWAEKITLQSESVRGPYFFCTDQFAVHFSFEFITKSTGQRVTQEEVGVYTVKDGKIVREVFYNQGNW